MRSARPHRNRIAPVAAGLASVVAALAVAPVAHTAPAGGTDEAATPASAHSTLDDALGAVGLDRTAFERQSAVAEHVDAAADGMADRHPEAFAGVRVDGTTGVVEIVPTAPGAAELTAEAAAQGLLPRPVDAPATDRRSAPSSPAERDGRARFHDAQGSSGSVGGTPPQAGQTGAGEVPAQPDRLAGGDRYLATDPRTGAANWCSLGFNGVRDGRVVNVTATHCSEFAGTTFSPARISTDRDQPQLGQFTAAEADTDLDVALVTVDTEDAPRFRNDLVRGSGGTGLTIDGHQRPVVGQTVCKYGERSAYTCGTVSSVEADYSRHGREVMVDMCALAGDSGGVVFSGHKAIAITSQSNAFYQQPAGSFHSYSSCADAGSGLAPTGDVPQTIGITLDAVLDRYPGLELTTR